MLAGSLQASSCIADTSRRRAASSWLTSPRTVWWVRLAIRRASSMRSPPWRCPSGLRTSGPSDSNCVTSTSKWLPSAGSRHPWSGRVKKLLMLSVLIGAVPMYGWRAELVERRSCRTSRPGCSRTMRSPLVINMKIIRHAITREARIYPFESEAPAESLSWAEGWIQRLMPVGKRLVFIAPGSIQPHKRWPLEKFAALVSALLSEFDDLFFVIIGTATDQELGEDIRRQHPDLVVNIAGTTSIAQSAALLRRDCLLVGNDGGAMHLGDAMGCKVVSIVPGIQYPNSIEPWHNRHLAVRHEVPCAPCYSFVTCPLGQPVMPELPLQAVLNSCRTALTTEPLKGRIVYTQTLQP